jgi:hypothetical protein
MLMLRPRISLGEHFAIVLLAVKLAAWLVSIVSCIMMALFRLGASCAKKCRKRRGGYTRASLASQRK